MKWSKTVADTRFIESAFSLGLTHVFVEMLTIEPLHFDVVHRLEVVVCVIQIVIFGVIGPFIIESIPDLVSN